jgi:hypothetical protein
VAFRRQCPFPRRGDLAKCLSSNDGRVAEWFKAPVLKTGVPARVPWVRIPPLPPVKAKSQYFQHLAALTYQLCLTSWRILRSFMTEHGALGALTGRNANNKRNGRLSGGGNIGNGNVPQDDERRGSRK